MINLINNIIEKLGANVYPFLHKMLDVTVKGIDLIDKCINYKQKKERIKEQKQSDNKIDNACDKGSLDDLFDLNKFIKTTIIVSSLILIGCKNTEIEIYTTKAWEGHYYTVEQFNKSTRNIELQKDESIWVLSNRSLKRILKEEEK